MQIAKYTDENGTENIVRAEQFQNDTKLAIKRKRLSCVGCGVKAAFRRKAINGKAPHFAASHDSDCDIPDDDTTEVVEATELKSVNELKNESGLIEIDLNFGSTKHIHGQEPKSSSNDLGGESRSRKEHNQTANSGTSIWRRRLSTLLKTVFEDKTFSNSEQLMLAPNGRKCKASSLFYPIEAVEKFNKTAKYPAFYFGIIDSAILHNGTLWLNTGTLEGTSIKIYDESTITNLIERYSLEIDTGDFNEISKLAGAQFLVYGFFTKAKSTDKLLVQPLKTFNANAICFRKKPKSS